MFILPFNMLITLKNIHIFEISVIDELDCCCDRDHMANKF